MNTEWEVKEYVENTRTTYEFYLHIDGQWRRLQASSRHRLTAEQATEQMACSLDQALAGKHSFKSISGNLYTPGGGYRVSFFRHTVTDKFKPECKWSSSLTNGETYP